MTTKVREVKLKNNQVGVMLDIHKNGKRTQKMLNIRYSDIPKTAIEREDKKQKKELVKKIISKMEVDALYSNNALDRDFKLDKNFFEYCDEFVKNKAPNSDTASYISVIKKLKLYTKHNKLICSEIDEGFLLGFKDYLDGQLNGVSSYNYFKKLKKIIKDATFCKYFIKSPMERIVNSKGKSIEKETLSTEDIQVLTETPCSNEEVKNAFLFSCLTGLRFCDISRLKWQDLKSGSIDIIQKKTKEHLILKLHQDTKYLIGKQKNAKDLLFQLPTHPSCLKHLSKWVEDAGIKKHITWHCSRHSFATALILENENITTVSKLLGHKSIRETENYIRVAEMSKQNAIDNLPSIFKSKSNEKNIRVRRNDAN